MGKSLKSHYESTFQHIKIFNREQHKRRVVADANIEKRFQKQREQQEERQRTIDQRCKKKY